MRMLNILVEPEVNCPPDININHILVLISLVTNLVLRILIVLEGRYCYHYL